VGALPSTLDLFAVSVLAEGNTPAQIELDNSIAYAEIQTTSIPEFSLNILLVIEVFALLCTLPRIGSTVRKIMDGSS